MSYNYQSQKEIKRSNAAWVKRKPKTKRKRRREYPKYDYCSVTELREMFSR